MARAPQPPATYRPAIVTFIDILGFRNLVAIRDAATIARALADLAYFTEGEEADSVPMAGAARSVQFSDSVVRVCPVDTEDQTGALFYELQALATAQYALACQGILLRGGVTLGEVHIEGATVFGPAMIRAYDLESSHACYPRILVDPVLLEAHASNPALQGEAHDLDSDRAYIDGLVTLDLDGLPFVDFLMAFLDNAEDVASLEGLRNHILAAFDSDLPENVRHKYVWLAAYFNRVVPPRTGIAAITIPPAQAAIQPAQA